MPLLADLQAGVRQAVTVGDARAVTSLLVGGVDPPKRLAIHQRHYRASLITTISERFPATAWLVGTDVVTDAARAFVQIHPPRRPCIVEYGEDFPAFLARHERVAALPYMRSFAELEWHVGQVSIAIDRTPVTWSDIVLLGSDLLLSARVELQPGLRYLRASWAVDRLMRTYLTDSAPEKFILSHTETYIEIRGARGAVQIESIAPATFAFRAALLRNRPVGDAAETALECDEAFDAGKALTELVAAGLVTRVATKTPRRCSGRLSDSRRTKGLG